MREQEGERGKEGERSVPRNVSLPFQSPTNSTQPPHPHHSHPHTPRDTESLIRPSPHVHTALVASLPHIHKLTNIRMIHGKVIRSLLLLPPIPCGTSTYRVRDGICSGFSLTTSRVHAKVQVTTPP